MSRQIFLGCIAGALITVSPIMCSAADISGEVAQENFLQVMACQRYTQANHDKAGELIATYEDAVSRGDRVTVQDRKSAQIAREMRPMMREVISFTPKDPGEIGKSNRAKEYISESRRIRKICKQLDVLFTEL